MLRQACLLSLAIQSPVGRATACFLSRFGLVVGFCGSSKGPVPHLQHPDTVTERQADEGCEPRVPRPLLTKQRGALTVAGPSPVTFSNRAKITAIAPVAPAASCPTVSALALHSIEPVDVAKVALAPPAPPARRLPMGRLKGAARPITLFPGETHPLACERRTRRWRVE
jgi:hypothetical protein